MCHIQTRGNVICIVEITGTLTVNCLLKKKHKYIFFKLKLASILCQIFVFFSSVARKDLTITVVNL